MQRTISPTGRVRPTHILRRAMLASALTLGLSALGIGWSAGLLAQAPDAPVLPVPGKLDGNNVTGVRAMVIQVNSTKTLGMTRAPGATEDPLIAKVHNEDPKVVKVQSIVDDPRHVLVTGLAGGLSRLTFTSRDGKEEGIDIRVPFDDERLREQQRKDFLEQVRKAVPTANIEAVVAPNNTVFLTGWLKGPEDTQAIIALTRSIWGAQANVVDQMRIARVPQIEIDTTIAVVNRSKVRSAAFSWVQNGRGYYLSSMLATNSFTNTITNGVITGPPIGFAANATATSTPANVAFGIVDPTGAFSGFIQALRTEGLAKIHSEPKIVTLSGKQAQLVSGGETPILTSSGIGSPTVTYKSFGTVVDVLPIVLGDGRISLEVKPSLSSLNAANGITLPGGGGTVVPGFDTRGCSVTVQMMDGETLAIGGLIQFTVNNSVSKVPVLGDLPFLGAAFSTKSSSEIEEELIILITPRLVDPMACNELPQRLPTKLTRNPDDFELFLEQLIELPRGPRQVCADGCYTAGYKNGPTAATIPCASTPRVDLGLRGAGTCASGSCASGTCATGTCGQAVTAPLKTSMAPNGTSGEVPASYTVPYGTTPQGTTQGTPQSGTPSAAGTTGSLPPGYYGAPAGNRISSDLGALPEAPTTPSLPAAPAAAPVFPGDQPAAVRSLRLPQ
jgi:pilus assembly protein CpaC